jgi:hypothetical protein
LGVAGSAGIEERFAGVEEEGDGDAGERAGGLEGEEFFFVETDVVGAVFGADEIEACMIYQHG